MSEKKPIKTPDVVMREEEKEALLFNPATGNIVCINSTGKFIWGLCDGKKTIGDIVKEIVEKFEVSEEDAGNDCSEFFESVKKSGFVGYKV